MDLKATACSRFLVKRENFQTRISLKGGLRLPGLVQHPRELGPVGDSSALGLVHVLAGDQVAVPLGVVPERPQLGGDGQVHVPAVAGNPGIKGGRCQIESVVHQSLLIAAFGVACTAEAPAPVPAEDIAAMVKEAVKESVPAAPAPAPAGPSAAEIRSMMQEAVAAAAPAAIDPNEIRRMVETAVKAGPGVSKDELTATIKAQMGEQMTAADVKKVVDSAIAAMPAPKIDTAAIRPLVEQAVVAAAPKGVSSAEIGAIVEAAVTAATKDVPSRGELEASIAKSVTEAAAGRLTAAEVQNIVAASLVATERAIGEATKAAQDAQMAAKEAGKEAIAVRTEAAAKAVVAEAPKVPEVRYVPKQQVAGVYWDFKYDGPRPTTFSESPELTKLVKAGLLPPVEERLPVPSDVLVIPPPDEIGVYGGTWRITDTRLPGPHSFGGLGVQSNADGEVFIPNVVKSWTISEDKS